MPETNSSAATGAPESEVTPRAPWQAPKVIVAEQLRHTQLGNAGLVRETSAAYGTRAS